MEEGGGAFLWMNLILLKNNMYPWITFSRQRYHIQFIFSLYKLPDGYFNQFVANWILIYKIFFKYIFNLKKIGVQAPLDKYVCIWNTSGFDTIFYQMLQNFRSTYAFNQYFLVQRVPFFEHQ